MKAVIKALKVRPDILSVGEVREISLAPVFLSGGHTISPSLSREILTQVLQEDKYSSLIDVPKTLSILADLPLPKNSN